VRRRLHTSPSCGPLSPSQQGLQGAGWLTHTLPKSQLSAAWRLIRRPDLITWDQLEGRALAEQLPNWRDKEITNGGGLGFQAEWPEKPGGGTRALPTEASGGLAWGSAGTWQQGMGESLGKKCRKAPGQGRIASPWGWFSS